MRRREVKIPLTPITEETFIRQGWTKITGADGFDESESNDGGHYYFTLPIPKDRDDEYATMFVSNATDEQLLLKDIGLKTGQFFVELMDLDGLGFCASEEELSVLYNALTGDDIEENLEN
jgi:hypothetical protein